MNECKLGDVISLITKGTTPTTLGGRFVDKGINFIKSEAISYDGRIDTSTFVFIDEQTYLKLKRSQLFENDILFSMAGVFLGKNSIVTKDILPANTNQALAIIRLKDNLAFPKFIHYFLRQESIIEFVNNMSGQSAQPNINFEEIKSIPIYLPPLREQKAIASVLSSLDDKIDLLHRQNRTLEEMAEVLFRKWFIDGKQENWITTTLEQHIDVSRGLSYKGEGLVGRDTGIPMHNLNSVYEGGGYKLEGIKFYKGEYKDRHIVYPGDIIVTNTEQGHEFRLIGFPAIIPDFFGPIGIFSQHIYKVSIKSRTYLSREFIYYLLMSPSVREQIISATNGSTVNMLSIDGLQRPEFKQPEKEKVDEFTTIIKGFWKKKHINSQQIIALSKLRDILLPKLMTGEIKIKQE